MCLGLLLLLELVVVVLELHLLVQLQLLRLPEAVVNELELEGLHRPAGTSFFPRAGRRKQRIHGDADHVVDHVGYESGEDGARGLQARVGIGLDEPDLEVFVDHKVQPEKLVAEHFVLGVHDEVPHPKNVLGDPLHFGVDALPEVQLPVGCAVQVSLELVEGELVAGFVLPVVLRVLLNCIVCQVNELAAAFEAELFGAGSDVPLLVPPSLPTTPKHPHSDIELAAIVEEGHDVPLDNVGTVLTVGVLGVLVYGLA